MKYIIEFEDESKLKEEGLSYYTCVDAPWFMASDQIIGKLTPYTEGEDYKQGTTDAWEFARYLNEIGRDTVESVYLPISKEAAIEELQDALDSAECQWVEAEGES